MRKDVDKEKFKTLTEALLDLDIEMRAHDKFVEVCETENEKKRNIAPPKPKTSVIDIFIGQFQVEEKPWAPITLICGILLGLIGVWQAIGVSFSDIDIFELIEALIGSFVAAVIYGALAFAVGYCVSFAIVFLIRLIADRARYKKANEEYRKAVSNEEARVSGVKNRNAIAFKALEECLVHATEIDNALKSFYKSLDLEYHGIVTPLVIKIYLVTYDRGAGEALRLYNGFLLGTKDYSIEGAKKKLLDFGFDVSAFEEAEKKIEERVLMIKDTVESAYCSDDSYIPEILMNMNFRKMEKIQSCEELIAML